MFLSITVSEVPAKRESFRSKEIRFQKRNCSKYVSVSSHVNRQRFTIEIFAFYTFSIARSISTVYCNGTHKLSFLVIAKLISV